MFDELVKKYSSYLWFIRKHIGKASTLLDLGCGNGQFMEALSSNKNWQITGVDLDKNYLKIARSRNIYTSLIYGDVITILKELIKMGQKFDIIFSSQLIEHLNKEQGQEMLKLAEKVAKKKVILSTTRGFIHQSDFYFDGNPLQHHKSGWSEGELKKMGYKIYGVGLKFVWSEHGLALTHNKLISFLFSFLAYILSPLVFLIPILGAGMIAIKNIKSN